MEQTGDLSPQDILVLDEVPVWLPPVAGLVTQRPSTLLSHVNLLAKGWGIPNAYVRDAQAALRQYDGQWVGAECERAGLPGAANGPPRRRPHVTPPKQAARKLPSRTCR